jgi:hypothetical protein
MFDTIDCYIAKDKIEVNHQVFQLGELSEDFLNTSREEFLEMDTLCRRLEYLDSPSQAFEARIEMQLLRTKLLKYKLFRLLLTSPRSDELDKFELPVWNPEEDYPDEPELVDEDEAELDPREIQNLSDRYQLAVHDIYAFNTAMFGFIDRFVDHLDKMDRDNYAEAFYNFSLDGYMKEHRGIPDHPERIFTVSDSLSVQYVPRKKSDGGYAIYECYLVERLQSFLKLDFYRALMVGHVIRRCKNCEKFFLLTSGFNTVYCDRPIPGRPHRNCRNQGAKNIAKLNAKNNPVLKEYGFAYGRVNTDYNRDHIALEERNRARKYLIDLRDEGLSGKYSDVELRALMQSEVLYKSLGIVRR